MTKALSRLDRRMKLIEDKIDARMAAIEKAFELESGPINSHKLTPREKSAYFASLSPEEQLGLWGEMEEDERKEIWDNMEPEQQQALWQVLTQGY